MVFLLLLLVLPPELIRVFEGPVVAGVLSRPSCRARPPGRCHSHPARTQAYNLLRHPAIVLGLLLLLLKQMVITGRCGETE